MNENIIFSNEYLKIMAYTDGIYIETFKKGFSIEKLNNIFHAHPEIDVTNFNTLKSSIMNAPRSMEKIGSLKERIVIETADNDLTATVLFNISNEDLASKKDAIISEVYQKLNEKGIITGIRIENLAGELLSGKHYVIAEGTPPVNGANCIIKMYELQESRPEVHDDGKVDFYDLKLINRVKAGDWLGERIEATDGTPGQSVKGAVIKPVKGKSAQLNYDKNTVREVLEGDKTTLYSRVNGAVSYLNGRITVSNHLEIDGDVDFKTGNIKFDGYITIKGSVMDGFSVEATRDIEINGDLGIGNVKGIVSTQGSIFIKGGIASKGRAEVRASKNIFTKFADNALLKCNGSVHIGFYCISSNVYAKEVIFDSTKSQVMGGIIKAEIRVAVPTIGSDAEKKTLVEVIGFSRDEYTEQLGAVIQKITDLKQEQQRLKQSISVLESQGQMNPFQRKAYNDTIERMQKLKDDVKELEDSRKNIAAYLRTHGEGEICITKKAYPNSVLTIKGQTIEVTSVLSPSIYYSKDGSIKQV